ncbi:MAG: histidine kinase, partial [Psychrosphaera sp.]|nr:histidine kinase [Psychrosphaera sp.]
MCALSTNEQLKALLVLALLYLVPTLQDVGSRQTQFGWQLIASTTTWMVCFYWAPFLLFIQLKQRLRWTVNAAVELVAFVGLMFLGINLVNLLLNQLFPGFTIEPLQRAASAILWGIFIYTIYRLWIMQQSLLQEQLLRKEAQLKALKNQLNPHFLFNSLNTISSFIH